MKLETALALVLLAGAAIFVADLYIDTKKCEALGGTMVRTSFSYTCANLEILK